MRSFPVSLVAATLGLAALSAPADAAVTVHVYNFDFGINPSPAGAEDPVINLGETIHWVWDSGFHSVTSVSGIPEVFNSGDHSPSFTFDHTFTHTGTFWYYCDIHGFDLGTQTAGGMAGTVTVLPAPGPSAVAGLAALAFYSRRRRPA